MLLTASPGLNKAKKSIRMARQRDVLVLESLE